MEFTALDTLSEKVQSLMSKQNIDIGAATLKVLQSNPRLYGAYLDERPEAMTSAREKRDYVQGLSPRLAALGLGTAINGVATMPLTR